MKSIETEYGRITGHTKAGEEAVELFAKACKQAHERRKLFMDYVRALGADGALKNDGWIDREKKRFQWPSYAYFDDGVTEGSLVAIGDEYKYKMVVITKVEKTWWRTKYYYFRDKRF